MGNCVGVKEGACEGVNVGKREGNLVGESVGVDVVGFVVVGDMLGVMSNTVRYAKLSPGLRSATKMLTIAFALN